MPVPRCFIVRHGETEWSLNGRHTGTTDIPLTANGEKRVKATGKALVGDDRLIAPKRLNHVYVSPRKRAQRTFELLQIGCKERLPWIESESSCSFEQPIATEANIEITDAIREWDYGDYEGLTSPEIRELRAKQGLGKWDIWRDGCPGGESPEDICRRLDAFIANLREKNHKHCFGSPDNHEKGDVLVVAHGHILRALAIRWVGKPLTETALILEAGGVGTLSYEHHNIEEPAIILGGAFVVED
ncbi:phosphoglycerate mutase family protein [Talaromyces stipitatus ATCC 10500]|uniref:Phosphoglycerate mutase family protein n=1 Tax=Talaromyces stipitatus (strain ATCC 10500 / CBS 375.48 / QM 6759 / NRRL 1006) TaxID=441959 RepID=B8MKN0_TALSN|nr:phosphoglycerate mutase family protein [Talaromyces stipitatus ATCC 10500]EED15385.1 phosphoglycerate mutase family protein [Talaromyces stipitatus ATCC 10500]